MYHLPADLLNDLQHLIAVHNDASNGYMAASNYVANPETEILFEKIAYQRSANAKQIDEFLSMFKQYCPNYENFALLERTWMDHRLQMRSGSNEKMIHLICTNESAGISIYERIFKNYPVSVELSDLLKSQLTSIRNNLLLIAKQLQQPAFA